MKTHRIFLDNYEMCKKEEADLIIIPNKESNAPNICYKRKTPHWIIKEVTNDLVWDRYSKIDINGTQDQYNQLVSWWFSNMTDEYKDFLLTSIESAVEMGFDLAMSISKAESKLKVADKEKRKSNIHKFLTSWILTGGAMYRNRKNENTLYS
jgi:hypothetical protein